MRDLNESELVRCFITIRNTRKHCKRRIGPWFNWYWNRGRWDRDNNDMSARQKSWRRVF